MMEFLFIFGRTTWVKMPEKTPAPKPIKMAIPRLLNSPASTPATIPPAIIPSFMILASRIPLPVKTAPTKLPITPPTKLKMTMVAPLLSLKKLMPSIMPVLLVMKAANKKKLPVMEKLMEFLPCFSSSNNISVRAFLLMTPERSPAMPPKRNTRIVPQSSRQIKDSDLFLVLKLMRALMQKLRQNMTLKKMTEMSTPMM